MKKRWIFLIILGLFLIFFLIFVFRLTYKNSTLRYLSDDTRQVELLKELSTSIIQNTIQDENIKLDFDSEFFLNFVNNTAFVTSQKEDLYNEIMQYSNNSKATTIYTISSNFNPKKLMLTIKFASVDANYEFNYKLHKGRNNTIKYKEKRHK